MADNRRLGTQQAEPWRRDGCLAARVAHLALEDADTFFARAERCLQDELFLPADPRDHETFTVGKLTGGYIYDFPTDGHFKVGVGGLASKYSLPSELDPVYGSNPTSFMLFARIKIQ